MNRPCESVPSLTQLLKGPVILGCQNGCHRQLRAAGLYANVTLRLRLETQEMAAEEGEDEGDEDSWTASAAAVTVSTATSVVCPQCEEDDFEDQRACPLCQGVGLVHRSMWLDWYYANKACRDYAEGCEQDCQRTECLHDTVRSPLSLPYLVLEVQKGGKNWAVRGDSLSGFKLVGLARNRLALTRFLALVLHSCGLPVEEE